jgi:hypothetical protein
MISKASQSDKDVTRLGGPIYESSRVLRGGLQGISKASIAAVAPQRLLRSGWGASITLASAAIDNEHSVGFHGFLSTESPRRGVWMHLLSRGAIDFLSLVCKRRMRPYGRGSNSDGNEMNQLFSGILRVSLCQHRNSDSADNPPFNDVAQGGRRLERQRGASINEPPLAPIVFTW